MGLDDADDVAAFLDHYANACADLGIDPLVLGDLADLVAALIAVAPRTLH